MPLWHNHGEKMAFAAHTSPGHPGLCEWQQLHEMYQFSST